MIGPRILYIARAYPPTTGGMENLALHLSTHMRAHADVTTILNRRGKKALPAFLPYALGAALRKVRSGRVDAICLSDAMLAPLGAALRIATGVPVVATVHGLDVTWTNRAYQAVVPPALTRLDLVMPNSAATDAAMRARTGTRPPSLVVPLGVNPLAVPDDAAIAEFERMAGVGAEDRLLLTVGRLVERKGAAWFAGQVLPSLPSNTIWAVIGEGPQREAIIAAAARTGVAGRMRLLGRVSDQVLAAAYRRAELFLMPNVPVTGDIEGFGLVALEASASGLPVVASRLDGITEAVQHERNGVLVRAGDGEAWASHIRRLLALPPRQLRSLGAEFAEHTTATFGWDRTAQCYVHAIAGVIAGCSTTGKPRAA